MDLWSLPQSILAGLAYGGQYMGIPQGDIRNASGQVVFPTNGLEKFLANSAAPTNQFAAAFIGPGAKGTLTPAVRFGNETFTGLNHGIAYGNAEAAGRIYGPAKEGFVTPDGSFLDRGQAFDFAKRAGQLTEQDRPAWDKRLATEDINPAAYK